MTIRYKVTRWVAGASLALASAVPALADQIATVLAVNGTAQTPAGLLEAGDRIEDGLTIRTDGDTNIQLEFDDGTRMAVGPNSEMQITSVLMQSNGQASRFAVNSVAGTFRMLTGDSRREAYEITTPNATIGIRGTEFDWTVFADSTSVSLYRGAIRLCLLDGSKCWEYRGGCAVAVADRGRNVVRGLRSGETAGALSIFPYALSQAELLEELRTSIESCNRHFPDEEDELEDEEFYEDDFGQF